MADGAVVVIGAGTGVGLAVARAFGGQDRPVAMIARTQSRLDAGATGLRAEGIEAQGFAADVSDPDALKAAIARTVDAFGEIGTLFYGPKPEPEMLTTPREITLACARTMFDRMIVGAVTAVEAVLPAMVERRSGSIVFAVPASAIEPVLYSANMAMATSALRSYALGLYTDLIRDGVYAGVVCIAGSVVEGSVGRERHLAAPARKPEERGWEEYRKFEEELTTMIPAEEIATLVVEMQRSRDRAEVIIGDADICRRMRDDIVAEARRGHMR